MQVLVHPLAILRLILAPVFQWCEVIILPVDLYAIVFDQLAHMVGKPLAAFWVTQVQQTVSALLRSEQPFRVFGIEFCAPCYPFRLKPD